MRNMYKIYLTTAVLSAALLCGCGVKPDSLDPPSGHENSSFPRTYPDTELETHY
jgi:hypothetical protein